MESSPKLAVVLLLAVASIMVVVTAQNSPQDYVAAHNAARADVGLGEVSWNATVATSAERYMEQHRADCQMVHSPADGPYGENLYKSTGIVETGVDAVNLWVTEKQYYDHSSNSCSAPVGKACGHYTQVVWRDSTSIGCARVVCDGGAGVLIICRYSPKGNWEGQSPY